jgi:subtilisin-like proprotein convertase family protein
MKLPKLLSLSILSSLMTAPAGRAATSFNSTVGADIPDNSANGVSASQSVTGVGVTSGLTVQLEIDGRVGSGYLGDLYVILTHGSDYAVLLNRPGRSSSDLDGYANNGLKVTFDDKAANGDIHTYRVTYGGTVSAAEPLTGIWAPDGRTTDPDHTVASDSRSATLSSFDGKNANGVWTLSVYDLSPGGTSELVNWELDFGTSGKLSASSVPVTPIPEPSWAGWMGACLALGWLFQARSSTRVRSRQ